MSLLQMEPIPRDLDSYTESIGKNKPRDFFKIFENMFGHGLEYVAALDVAACTRLAPW